MRQTSRVNYLKTGLNVATRILALGMEASKGVVFYDKVLDIGETALGNLPQAEPVNASESSLYHVLGPYDGKMFHGDLEFPNVDIWNISDKCLLLCRAVSGRETM